MTHMNPNRFQLLMRRNRWTIRTLARAAGVTQARVRQLRTEGIAIGRGSLAQFGPCRNASEAALAVWSWTRILKRQDTVAA